MSRSIGGTSLIGPAVVAAAGLLLLGARAQPVKEAPAASSLSPVPEPALDVGYGFVALREDQTEQVTKIVAQTDTER